jgi:hypothetical protein
MPAGRPKESLATKVWNGINILGIGPDILAFENDDHWPWRRTKDYNPQIRHEGICHHPALHLIKHRIRECIGEEFFYNRKLHNFFPICHRNCVNPRHYSIVARPRTDGAVVVPYLNWPWDDLHKELYMIPRWWKLENAKLVEMTGFPLRMIESAFKAYENRHEWDRRP